MSIIICTVCPKGCEINVIEAEEERHIISGYSCEKGMMYAEQEIKNPSRIITTTVNIKNAAIKRLPVRSDRPVAKNELLNIVGLIRMLEVYAPIEAGDVVERDISGTGINIIASRSVPLDKDHAYTSAYIINT
ncbi:MAG: DUF1667 domain-containing protein [Clostridiaceae bacterium]